jgi:hypothetical protein
MHPSIPQRERLRPVASCSQSPIRSGFAAPFRVFVMVGKDPVAMTKGAKVRPGFRTRVGIRRSQRIRLRSQTRYAFTLRC